MTTEHHAETRKPGEPCSACGEPVITIGWQELGVHSTTYHRDELGNIAPVEVGEVDRGSELSMLLNRSAAAQEQLTYLAREVVSVDETDPNMVAVGHQLCAHCQESLDIGTPRLATGDTRGTINVEPGVTYREIGSLADPPVASVAPRAPQPARTLDLSGLDDEDVEMLQQLVNSILLGEAADD